MKVFLGMACVAKTPDPLMRDRLFSITGVKTQDYHPRYRSWIRKGTSDDARRDILSSSRAWGTISRDFFDDAEKSKELVYRHLAWLTALRYQMREHRAWETTSKAHNAEYLKYYFIPERQTALETELARLLSDAELTEVLAADSKATRILGLQSKAITGLFSGQVIGVSQFVDMQRSIKDFFSQQGRCERIKDFPYPRQFAMVWLVIPFSVLISWMYTSLGRVGESTESPFEGSANDVPISHMCRTAEMDLREMLGETGLPTPPEPTNNIVL